VSVRTVQPPVTQRPAAGQFLLGPEDRFNYNKKHKEARLFRSSVFLHICKNKLVVTSSCTAQAGIRGGDAHQIVGHHFGHVQAGASHLPDASLHALNANDARSWANKASQVFLPSPTKEPLLVLTLLQWSPPGGACFPCSITSVHDCCKFQQRSRRQQRRRLVGGPCSRCDYTRLLL
jgi:hypothetical protein